MSKTKSSSQGCDALPQIPQAPTLIQVHICTHMHIIRTSQAWHGGKILWVQHSGGRGWVRGTWISVNLGAAWTTQWGLGQPRTLPQRKKKQKTKSENTNPRNYKTETVVAALCGLAVQKWTCFSRCSQLCCPTRESAAPHLAPELPCGSFWPIDTSQKWHELWNPELRSPCRFLPLPRGAVPRHQKLKPHSTIHTPGKGLWTRWPTQSCTWRPYKEPLRLPGEGTAWSSPTTEENTELLFQTTPLWVMAWENRKVKGSWLLTMKQCLLRHRAHAHPSLTLLGPLFPAWFFWARGPSTPHTPPHHFHHPYWARPGRQETACSPPALSWSLLLQSA